MANPQIYDCVNLLIFRNLHDCHQSQHGMLVSRRLAAVNSRGMTPFAEGQKFAV
jgi:hypothetical protein